ncbi:MAG TPA: OB-fold nucleic acid binding domain-containing protein [Desulfuromonadaceae bacterium]|jgi:hypothetical protein
MKKKAFLSLTLLVFLSTSAFAVKPPGHGGASQGMMGGAAAAPASNETISGKVLQTMNSGGYSYVNLQKNSGDKIWIAVPEAPIKSGAQMSFQSGMEMKNFESKSLKRTFDSIIFSSGVIASQASAASAAEPKKEASPGSKGAATPKEEKITVTKAKGANATTIENAYLNSAKLDKKKVVIRGKVVKVSAGIMGKNWIHIQDGTGSQAKRNHNMVCTSSEMAKVGDVITVTGILAKDRDFGSGYRYDAIVENATFKK